VAESGYPGYEATNWYAYLVPVATPREIVGRLNTELVKVLRQPEVRDLLNKQGVEPQPGTPDELKRYMESEHRTWGRVVKDAGIKAQ
jgi:tripartite-type tricarboxylate transporter receptor subunit TctC